VIEKEVIHSLLDNWLVEEITIQRGKPFRYYSPHLMIRRVVRKTLPKFEDKHHETFESLAKELYQIANSNIVGNHNYEEAINLYRCVEKLLEYLVNKTVSIELSNNLAMAYMNKGISLDSLGKLNEAIAEYDKAIEILKLFVDNGRTELANDLASAFMNKGISLWSLGKLNEALIEYGKAIEILEPLVEQGRTELANDLAMAYMNKATTLYYQKNYSEAETDYDKSIKIQEGLVTEENRVELTNDLAKSYWSKGNTVKYLGRIDEAIKFYDKSINLFEQTLQRGEVHNLPNMAIVLGIRFGAYKEAGNADSAEKDMRRLHELLELTKQHKEIEHLGEYIQKEIDKQS
jgi:tetratricopeptide (TPR) repeat protein